MAMFTAIIGIRVAEAYLNGSIRAKGNIEDGRGANRRSAHFSQCAQYSHAPKYITTHLGVSNRDIHATKNPRQVTKVISFWYNF
jgi:hypothetical protein